MTNVRTIDRALGFAQQEQDTDWTLTPAKTAVKLSRGRWNVVPHLEMISNEIAKIKEHPIFLIVTMPPRHGKSELISHWTPVWFLKNWPWKRIILASYEADFAATWGGKAKASIEESYSDLDLKISQDTKAKAQWMIEGYGGEMYSAGIRGAITGRGGDLIIIDDPVKNHQEANSAAFRESIWDGWRSVILPRAEPNASFIIIMTRWHEGDLVGRLLSPEYTAGDPKLRIPWKVINLPAIAETKDIIGRPEGKPLWPARFNLNALMRLRESEGPYWWSALYCGRPSSEGSGKFNNGWFQYYSDEELNHLSFSRVTQFWDTAFKKEQRNDRSACITIGETKKGYYIFDCYYGRPEFPELTELVKQKNREYTPDRIEIEDKASGQSLIQQLRRDTKLAIHAIKPRGGRNESKEARANAVTGIVEAGKVFLPSRVPWLQEFLNEVCGFPTAPHDDILDAFVWALLSLRPTVDIQVGGGSLTGEKKSAWRD